jgi:hypothetical protein
MVDLGAEVVTLIPGAKVQLPVTLNVQGDGPTQITLEVGYPGNLLTFVNFQPGAAVDYAKGNAKATPKAGENADAQQVLVIEIQASEALASGALGVLHFTLPPAAKAGMEIPLKNIRRTVKGKDGKEMQNRGAEGLITLLEAPAPCFFYMH